MQVSSRAGDEIPARSFPDSSLGRANLAPHVIKQPAN